MKLLLLVSFLMFSSLSFGQLSISLGTSARLEGHELEHSPKSRVYYNLSTEYDTKHWRFNSDISYLSKTYDYTSFHIDYFGGSFSTTTYTYNYSAQVKYSYLGLGIGGSRLIYKEGSKFQFNVGLGAQLDFLINEDETFHEEQRIDEHSNTFQQGVPPNVSTVVHPTSYDRFNAVNFEQYFTSFMINTGYRYYFNNVFIHLDIAAGVNFDSRSRNNLFDYESRVEPYYGFKIYSRVNGTVYGFLQVGLKVGYTFNKKKKTD